MGKAGKMRRSVHADDVLDRKREREKYEGEAAVAGHRTHQSSAVSDIKKNSYIHRS